MIGKIGRIASLIMVLALAYPQKSVAEDFTGKEFLTWETKEQDWYFQTSVTMASFITSRNNPEQSQCIGDWYMAEQQKRNTAIRDTMRDFPDYHPMGVIIAVLEKACGKF